MTDPEAETYLAWSDPSRRRPVTEKVQQAAERFIEKTGRVPGVVLCHPDDAAMLGTETAVTLNGTATALVVRGVGFVGRHTFYVGDAGDGRGLGGRQREASGG